MHEASIIQSLLENLKIEVDQRGGGRVTEIELLVGKASGVHIEALEFAFEACKLGSLAETALLLIIPEPLVGHCHSCDLDFTAENHSLVCPQCQAGATLTKGQELILQRFVLEQD